MQAALIDRVDGILLSNIRNLNVYQGYLASIKRKLNLRLAEFQHFNRLGVYVEKLVI